MGSPGPLTPPSASLLDTELPTVETAHSWFRTFPDRPDCGPLYFGTAATNRFDDPLQKYGVLYLARDIFGSFIETFGQGALHDPAQQPDGILYRCRHDPERIAAALFDTRVKDVGWPELSRHRWIDLGITLRGVLNHYRQGLMDGETVPVPPRKGPTQLTLP